MDSFHEHEKVSIKHGLEYEALKLYMDDFSRQLSKAFYALETKAAEEPAEQPLDLRVLLNILFKAAEEHSQAGQQDPQQSGLLVKELASEEVTSHVITYQEEVVKQSQTSQQEVGEDLPVWDIVPIEEVLDKE